MSIIEQPDMHLSFEEVEFEPLTDEELDDLEQGRVGCRCSRLLPEVRVARALQKKSQRSITHFKCPKCGATPQVHGKGSCLSGGRDCEGLICECDLVDNPESDSDTHGESFANPCSEANCYHCGWGGTVPAKPRGAQAWEKKALGAGWTPPVDRAKELGL